MPRRRFTQPASKGDLLALLDKENATPLWESVLKVCFRLLVPFLLGGLTFKFAVKDREVIVSIKAELAELKQKLEAVHETPSMAGAGIPFSVPTPKPKTSVGPAPTHAP